MNYEYDEWGRILSITNRQGTPITSDTNIGLLNPFRYRSYIYDDETELYYLKSRYYDPVTGRFINADIYCDTSTNPYGTNMFAYCNDNFINQIDPEGTDAYWLQFEKAVNNNTALKYGAMAGLATALITYSHLVGALPYSTGFPLDAAIVQGLIVGTTVSTATLLSEHGFGHTSLLIQDGLGCWWYFYWGDRQVILRPCGKDSFENIYQMNAYITGFDARKGHNYYVFATNVIADNEDINYRYGDNFYLKCHDKEITNIVKIKGDSSNSFNYACNLCYDIYEHSDATQLFQYINEGIYGNCRMFLVCREDYINGIYYFPKLDVFPEEKKYDLYKNNCVQVSCDVLSKGSYRFYPPMLWNTLRLIPAPNIVYQIIRLEAN